MKRLVFPIGVFVFSLLVVALLSVLYINSSLQPVGGSRPVNFVVTQNQPTDQVLSGLHSQGLVRSLVLARIFVRLFPDSARIRPGAYLLNSDQSFTELLSTLGSGPKDIWVTFPEGWRREQYAARLASVLPGFDSAAFLSATAELEGYLFPDTYLIPLSASAADIANLLTANFTRKAKLDRAVEYPITYGSRTLNLTGHQLVILASLVEREARHDYERTQVASVLLNRYQVGMPLQVDATVQFARDSANCQLAPVTCNFWAPIFDTKFPSLYNTYQHSGLPPGPIASPGLATLTAVSQPEPTDFLYYITGRDGISRFARTYAEHNANIDKYLR